MNYFKYFLLLFILVNISCEEILFEVDISNSSVVLISPSDNAELPFNSIFLDWEKVEDATEYEVQIATPNFDEVQQLLLSATDSITAYEVQLNVGDYEWRVKAKNSSYETQFKTYSFKVIDVANFPDITVILESPEDNLITNEVNQNLQWQSVDGATLYRIQILENGTVSDEETTAIANLNYTFSEGNYNWQVRAENGVENTLYSSRNILVDITSPNTPFLTQPIDEAILTSTQVSFEWTRDPNEGSSEFDTINIYRDVNLTDLVLSDQVTSPFTTTLANGTYYWFVQAIDEAGNEGGESTVFSFTIN
jgi:hypothetical protein